ncbi:MAG: hypothetical protein KA780_01470 [Prolixibacteraceae bacterium]|jgi:hypothetical protein|nr:hypothetical protein [Prolixibacteraceae bacterium]
MKILRTQRLWPVILAAGGVLSLLFWALVYRHHLVAREENQLFLTTPGYFLDHLGRQGGFSIYLGEFFTQFFLFPWAGALGLTLWMVIMAHLLRRLIHHFSGRPEWALLALFPPLVYSFLLCDVMYPFGGVIATVLSLAASLWGLRLWHQSRWRPGLLFLLPLVWWLAGGAFLLTLLILLAGIWMGRPLTVPAIAGIQEEGSRTWEDPARAPGTGIPEAVSPGQGVPGKLLLTGGLLLEALAIPCLLRNLLPADTLLQTYLSEAFYKIRILFPRPLQFIFAGIPLMLVVVRLASRNMGPRPGRMVPLLILLLSGITGWMGFRWAADPGEERELAFGQMAARGEWKEIIALAEGTLHPGPDEKLAVALALAMEGQLTSQMFQLPLSPEELFRRYERKGMTPMIASESYYRLGLVNFARMMAMESLESTPDGRLPVRAVKRVAETFILDGRPQLARKYLHYLRNTLFYRQWATEALAMAENDDAPDRHPEWGAIRQRMPREDFYYNGDQMELALLYLLRSDPSNRAAYEFLMAGYLWKKDFDAFLKYLPLSRSMGYQETPLVFSEAVAYLETLTPELPAAAAMVQVPPQVRERLEAYARAYTSGGKEDPAGMNRKFGKTYWYYLHFSPSGEPGNDPGKQ